MKKTALVEQAWTGQDGAEEATRTICRVWTNWQNSKPSADGIPDITKKINPLRQNIGLVPEGMRADFAKAVAFQDNWIARSNKIVTHGQPHHYNIVPNDQGELELVNPDSVMAPPSYDMAFVVGNPHNFDRSVEENISYLMAPGRLRKQMEIISEETRIPVQEIANAVLCHSFTVASKRYWSRANGHFDPSQVGPKSFLRMAEQVSPFTSFGSTSLVRHM